MCFPCILCKYSFDTININEAAGNMNECMRATGSRQRIVVALYYIGILSVQFSDVQVDAIDYIQFNFQ